MYFFDKTVKTFIFVLWTPLRLLTNDEDIFCYIEVVQGPKMEKKKKNERQYKSTTWYMPRDKKDPNLSSNNKFQIEGVGSSQPKSQDSIPDSPNGQHKSYLPSRNEYISPANLSSTINDRKKHSQIREFKYICKKSVPIWILVL